MPLPLSETIAAGQAGHIAAHNDIDHVENLSVYRRGDAVDYVVDIVMGCDMPGLARGDSLTQG